MGKQSHKFFALCFLITQIFAQIFIVFAVQFFSSCSLDYKVTPENIEDNVPELTFSKANFIRYEAGRQIVNFSADEIEQYSDATKMFAKNIEFIIYDEEGKVETTGSCGLMSSDTALGIYELYDDIRISNAPREMELKAKALRWNDKTEQLTSGRNDTISITKNNTTLYGAGFSASAVSNSFIFAGAISGTVKDEAEAESEPQQTIQQTTSDDETTSDTMTQADIEAATK